MVVATPREELFNIVGPSNGLLSIVKQLNRIVDSYKEAFRLERTSARDVDGLAEMYDSMTCLVVFPAFNLRDVMEVVRSGGLFPPGITRFIISPRALRINYPLKRLLSDKPLKKKQADLKKRIKSRLLERRVRYYRESTYLFDE